MERLQRGRKVDSKRRLGFDTHCDARFSSLAKFPVAGDQRELLLLFGRKCEPLSDWAAVPVWVVNHSSIFLSSRTIGNLKRALIWEQCIISMVIYNCVILVHYIMILRSFHYFGGQASDVIACYMNCTMLGYHLLLAWATIVNALPNIFSASWCNWRYAISFVLIPPDSQWRFCIFNRFLFIIIITGYH